MQPHLGDIVRELREDAGLSLRELARRSNVDISTLSRLEAHVHDGMTRENLARVTQALHTTVTDIERRLGRDDDRPVPRKWPSLEEVLARDKDLTQVQRDALLAVYRAYTGRR